MAIVVNKEVTTNAFSANLNVGETFLREKIQFLMILPIELPIFYHTHIP